ncbi:sensor histidine kinase [Cytobacillus purgationiresistens]|uniref:histidine kinase n=1 Tax=Cytobacillus purgationiresistens TaxID=863449 RepID=A0ABU0AM30_9BACI|nr:sensor histidine kinase [Cytobacillus purgationiresistens]MDQ0271852.1 OmpR family two-component system bacitracin resistance sensor histidine kinase BceS [Cytobacillus purgationiresistens]
MWLAYLRERLSWILLFLFLIVLMTFIAYIDATISLSSILYIAFLFVIIFLIFVFIRYQKETRYYKSLEDWENSLDITNIAAGNSPFEKIIEDSLDSQTAKLNHMIDQKQTALEQEKDDLLSWIHEVKTPLTAMQLKIERLEEDTLKLQLSYEWLRVHLLLDQQLHQSRIPSIENDLYIEDIQLDKLIYKEIRELQPWCMEKGIGFDIDLKKNELLSDAKWLGFIIRQLLTNAVKYSDSADIEVKSAIVEGKNILTINDYGRGIAVKDLPRIFDRGFTSTTDHTGHAATGMGLYLAQKAADALHIQISVDSELARGTTFSLTFPEQNEFVRITCM